MIEGLEIIRTIQTTDRFEAYEAKYVGEKVFAKKALIDKTRELLARVPDNSKVADELGVKGDFKFRSPDVITQEGDWLVTEWIDGQPLSEYLKTDMDKVAEILNSFLLVFDRRPVLDCEIRKTFKPASLDQYMAEKLPKSLSQEQQNTIRAAKKLFDEMQPTLRPAWQDGDIKPEHIFRDPGRPGTYVLIDPEHLDPRWPRFYSLANNYVKYVVRGPKKFSYKLLEKFAAQSGLREEDIFKPLLASILVRGISLHWEVDYDPGANSYNIPRAQGMLKVCLAARSLDDLY